MDKKSILRSKAKLIRQNLDILHISEKLCNLLINSEFYKTSSNIMLFYPLDYEINLLSIVKDNSKNFYLPRVNGDILECCPYRDGDELSLSDLKIYEPVCEPCSKKEIDLVIAPALLCDKNNYRLGYGGGYYDKFLTNFCGKKAVCIPKELIVDELPISNYDIPMDYVLIT